jgi:hypothetical protein
MRRRRPARDLRAAIDRLPLHTRHAMLAGIQANRIIVGGYTDGRGGVCPMLAAHRNGGRTSLASFARAWDRYTGAPRRPRAATGRELNALTAMLEASILLAETPAMPKPETSRRWVRQAETSRRSVRQVEPSGRRVRLGTPPKTTRGPRPRGSGAFRPRSRPGAGTGSPAQRSGSRS